MGWESPNDAMPWVGLYIAVASLICTLAMAADVVRSFWQWKLWFPNKYFTLNASTITLMAVALKLPVDLTTEMSTIEARTTKMTGVYFLVTMLANFLPSLGLMDDGELVMNTTALGILVTTIIVNMWIQVQTLVLTIFSLEAILLILCFPFIWPFSVALTVSTCRKKLEQRYKESQEMVSSHQEKMFSSKDLRRYVKRYWMMTETRNPQFVIACSPVSSAFGIICAFLVLLSTTYFLILIDDKEMSTSEYDWSIKIIFIIQSLGIMVGSIAPVFRCITSIGHYSLSKKWSKNQLNVFRVEKHWIQMLLKWKHSHIHSYIPGRHCKIVFHGIKKTFLNFCIVLHILVLVICKIISLAPRTFLIILSCCWYLFKLVMKKFKKIIMASNSNVSSEIEEYTKYVVQIEEEAKLSRRILKNTLHSITQLLDESEKKAPCNLMMLLEKSSGFDGVTEFDNDRTPPLYSEETHYCWSLVIVTLTAIGIALPNVAKSHFKGLLLGISEALQIVRHIEECLDTNSNSVKVRKAARQGWTEIEVYHTWLQIKLQNKTCNRKNSKEILRWLGEEATKVVIQFKSSKKPSIDQSPYKFILAGSMYRISQTVLLHCNEQEKLSNDEQVFEWISTMIADILSACFTNLPRVIKMKCYHHAIEKRGDNIRTSAQLLGRSKKILKILKTRQLPNIDPDSMAYIDNWRELNMTRTPISGNISCGGASLAGSAASSSTSSDSHIVTIM